MSAVYWLIEYGATFTEYYLSLYFSGTWVKVRASEKIAARKIIAGMLAALAMVQINQIDLYSPISVTLGFLLMIVLQSVVYFRNPVKASTFGIFFLLLVSLIDNLTVSALSHLFEISTAEIYQEMSLYRVLAIITSKTLLLFITVAVCKFFSGRETPERKYLFPLTGITIILFAATAAVTFMEIRNNTVNSNISVLFFVIVLILLMILFFGSFQMTQYYEDQQQLKLVTLKNQMLEQSIHETEQTFALWKTSVHDYKHSILNLTALAQQDDIQGIREYLSKENELLGKQLFYYKTGNETVDTVLNIKKKTAEDKGISFLIHAEIPQDCNVDSADFASMLGNLIDNAIEASMYETEPFIEIKMKSVKDFLVINISNKYTKSDLSLKTKKTDSQFHGIGLQSVRQTVRRYNGEFTTGYHDDIFEASIMLPL